MELSEKLKRVQLIVTDVDGVLTDGSILVTPQGEGKNFSVLDGMGFKLAEKAGIQTALLSGRYSRALEMRSQELGIKVVKMGRLDKQTALNEIQAELNIPLENMVFIGDDLPDIAPLCMVGCGFCPLDAHAAVKQHAFVVPVPGGKGVFRWVVEKILENQGKWQTILQKFEVQHDENN